MNQVIFTGRVKEKPKILSVEPLQVHFDVYVEMDEDGEHRKIRVPCFAAKMFAENVLKANPIREALVYVEGFLFQKKVNKNGFVYKEMQVIVSSIRRWKDVD
jgi:hypothetical protein